MLINLYAQNQQSLFAYMKAESKTLNMINWLGGFFASILSLTSCAEKSQTMNITDDKTTANAIYSNANYDTAYFGTGCFWCT